MSRRGLLARGAVLAALGLGGGSCAAAQEPPGGPALASSAGRAPSGGFVFESKHMGTTFRIVVHASDGAAAQAAATAAFARVAHLDSLLSDYRSDSEVADLARGAGTAGWVAASPPLWSVLEHAVRWTELTGGAFDVTVGPLTRLWRWSSRRGELPAPLRLAEARATVGPRHLVVDPAARAVRLTLPGMSLDFGGIAKGFAADAALGVLSAWGMDAALVDAGGDVALGAPPPGESGWLVALPGGDTLRLARAAVATSGDAHRYVEIGGVRYSHIVDPRTGLGVIDAPTVTVISRDATSADALASALTVMDSESGRALVRSLDGVSARVVGARTWTSDSFPGQRPGSRRQ